MIRLIAECDLVKGNKFIVWYEPDGVYNGCLLEYRDSGFVTNSINDLDTKGHQFILTKKDGTCLVTGYMSLDRLSGKEEEYMFHVVKEDLLTEEDLFMWRLSGQNLPAVDL